ncbi:MAG: quinolinate synthase NadA, partial [Calditrichaeota bacterium]|nr:quinolinate synthase NadA [Calditrichota bacterium]
MMRIKMNDFNIGPSLDLFQEIELLKKEHNAVIFAHYYQDADIQDVADLIGDSLQLAQEAKHTKAEQIVLCGVHFMAETAKMLSPNKKVLLPDLNAGCSLADSCPRDAFKAFRDAHPNHTVVTYVNSSADVKALTDICVTSTNAEKVIRSIPADKPIIFAPDKNLGKYLIKKTGRDMLLWNGSCMVHEIFSEKELMRLKAQYPSAQIIAHPECEEHILNHADFVGSTSALLNFVKTDQANEYIVLTEEGIIHQMKKTKKKKKF